MWQHWIFPKHTRTHVHTDCGSSITELRCLSEVRLFPVTRNDCWHWLNNNKKHNHENRYNTHNSSQHNNSFLSKERTIDQVKAHKSIDNPVSLTVTFPSHRFKNIWWWIAKKKSNSNPHEMLILQAERYSHRYFVYVALADIYLVYGSLFPPRNWKKGNCEILFSSSSN